MIEQRRVVETLLFYHPAVWWVSGRMRLERELCCDDLAVRVTGRRAEYAGALVELCRPGDAGIGQAVESRRFHPANVAPASPQRSRPPPRRRAP